MVIISKATIDDAEELLKIKINAFAWDIKTYGMGPPNYDSIDGLTEAINRGFYYKIGYGNKIAGGLSVYEHEMNNYELCSLYLNPEYQNKGIGSRVLELLEDLYPHVTRWILDTPYLSFRNHHFYENAGYIKVGEYKPFEGNDFILFKYEKNKEIG